MRIHDYNITPIKNVVTTIAWLPDHIEALQTTFGSNNTTRLQYHNGAPLLQLVSISTANMHYYEDSWVRSQMWTCVTVLKARSDLRSTSWSWICVAVTDPILGCGRVTAFPSCNHFFVVYPHRACSSTFYLCIRVLLVESRHICRSMLYFGATSSLWIPVVVMDLIHSCGTSSWSWVHVVSLKPH